MIGDLAENISGMRVIQAFAQESNTQDRFRAINRANRDANIAAMSLSFAFMPAVDILSVAATGIVLLAGGLEVIGLAWEPIAFQRDVIYPIWHPIRLLGYYATFAILYGTTYAIIGRIRKSKAPYKNSHGTDWMFLILLQLTTLTGIFIHFTRLLDWPMSTYVLYVIHLMVAIPMLVLEVPFSKWAHLAFRPVVIFLTQVKEQYQKDLEEFA